MTITKKIIVGFACVTAVVVGLGSLCLKQFIAVNSRSAVIERGIPSLLAIEEMQSRTLTNHAQLLRHVLTSDPSEIARLEASMKETSQANNASAQKYEAAISSEQEHKLFEVYQAERAKLLEARKAVLSASAANDKKQAAAILNTTYEPQLVAYQKVIQDLVDYNNSAVGKAVREVDEAAHSGTVASTVAVVAAFFIAAGVGFWTARSIRRSLGKITGQLSDSSNQVAGASSQVSASSQSMAQGASEQAASLEESSSALEEMASMIKKNADTSAQAAQISAEAKGCTDRGTEAMGKMTGAIADIERSSQETAKIIKVIDEIAFQTNLLALNAAVEAARAGEAGKGFAVVAEEVRNLAMRSAEAARNTSALIEESVGKARNGVTIAQTVASNLHQINEATDRVTGLIAEIAASSREQATGIDQITQSVGQMDKVTQTNAANAEETAAASEELSAQAEQLRGCVQGLLQLVGAADPSSRGAAPSAGTSLDTNVSVAAGSKRRLPPGLSGGFSTSSFRPQSKAASKAARELIPLETAMGDANDFSDFTGSKAA